MKKKLVYIIPLIALSFLAITPAVFAVVIESTPPVKELSEWLDTANIIARWLYTIILVISVFMALYAAILYLTAGGDQNKVKKASSTLIFAIVGIVVAILAFSISRIAIGLIS